MRYITKPTEFPHAQDVLKEKTAANANIYRVTVPKQKPKITQEHPYKGWGVSTNRGKKKQNPPA
jgi:hypothetical protein